jgi:hypothetical protein
LLSRRGRGAHLFAFRQRRQQRLPLGDLGHLGRWRKAFERGRKDVVRLDRAAGRLVELRQLQRRAEAETPRSLGLRHRDGGKEGLRGKLLPNEFHRSLPGLGHMIHHFAASEVAGTVRQMRASVGAGSAGPS